MIELKCHNCKKVFTRKKRGISENVFCSSDCYRKWMKINYRPFPITSGSSHHSYLIDIDHNVICEWCGKEFHAGAWRIKNSNPRFCSKECRRTWYAKEWSQREEWKQERREFALKQLRDGDMKKVDSNPQKIINKLLDEKLIKYKNEKLIGNFSFDNYIFQEKLILEIMGTYFHCDIRKFKKINYSNQLTRIRMDKIKHSFVLKNYGVEILYLWEKDIVEDLQLCSLLIDKYINGKGKIDNYHSANYEILNDKLHLKKDIIVPYMSWNIEEINSVVDLTLKRKINKKEKDKWIKFSCNQCGKEKEELISHYKNKEKHFCSQRCFQDYKKNNDWHRKTSPSSIKSNNENN